MWKSAKYKELKMHQNTEVNLYYIIEEIKIIKNKLITLFWMQMANLLIAILNQKLKFNMTDFCSSL